MSQAVLIPKTSDQANNSGSEVATGLLSDGNLTTPLNWGGGTGYVIYKGETFFGGPNTVEIYTTNGKAGVIEYYNGSTWTRLNAISITTSTFTGSGTPDGANPASLPGDGSFICGLTDAGGGSLKHTIVFDKIMPYYQSVRFRFTSTKGGALAICECKWYVLTTMSGAGTVGSPFLITNRTELEDMGRIGYGEYWYKLTADIDLAGSNWNPIGRYANNLYCNSTTGLCRFHLDGDGHSIKNCTVVGPAIGAGNKLGFIAHYTAYWKLASSVDMTGWECLKNIKFDIISVSQPGAYQNYMGMVIGAIEGTQGTGGYNNYRLMDSVAVVGGSLTSAYTGTTFVGGLLGLQLVGNGRYIYITNCYVQGNITHSGNSSGYGSGLIMGTNTNGGTDIYFQKCYSVGTVTGTGSYSDPICPSNDIYSHPTDCFFNGQVWSAPSGRTGITKIDTNAHAKTQSYYTNFDFTNIWKMGSNGYPDLKIMCGALTAIPRYITLQSGKVAASWR